MILIVGLGNPGNQYAFTRHNIAWLILDELNKAWDCSRWQKNHRGQTVVSQTIINRQKIILAKPLTYMNNSGAAVVYLKKYYKLKTDNIFIIHDELDLIFGRLKLNYNRGAGGHNGVKSVVQILKTNAFYRLRIGIKPAIKNPNFNGEKFVLQNFNKKEKDKLTPLITKAVAALTTAVTKSPAQAMNDAN